VALWLGGQFNSVKEGVADVVQPLLYWKLLKSGEAWHGGF
jgi:hypothetical protein